MVIIVITVSFVCGMAKNSADYGQNSCGVGILWRLHAIYLHDYSTMPLVKAAMFIRPTNANDIIAFRSLILVATVNFMMWFYTDPG